MDILKSLSLFDCSESIKLSQLLAGGIEIGKVWHQLPVFEQKIVELLFTEDSLQKIFMALTNSELNEIPKNFIEIMLVLQKRAIRSETLDLSDRIKISFRDPSTRRFQFTKFKLPIQIYFMPLTNKNDLVLAEHLKDWEDSKVNLNPTDDFDYKILMKSAAKLFLICNI